MSSVGVRSINMVSLPTTQSIGGHIRQSGHHSVELVLVVKLKDCAFAHFHDIALVICHVE